MKKKLFIVISAIAMTFTIITSNIFATEVESQAITQVGNYSTDVTIDGGVSTFSVTIPKNMGGNGESGTLDYDVRIVGDIAGNEVLSVIPDSTLTLSQTGKEDIIATISQLRTTFTGEDFALNATQTTTGSITYEGLSSGTWKGAFNFYISLTEKIVMGHAEMLDVSFSTDINFEIGMTWAEYIASEYAPTGVYFIADGLVFAYDAYFNSNIPINYNGIQAKSTDLIIENAEYNPW